jgi:hypothetical protein
MITRNHTQTKLGQNVVVVVESIYNNIFLYFIMYKVAHIPNILIPICLYTRNLLQSYLSECEHDLDVTTSNSLSI